MYLCISQCNRPPVRTLVCITQCKSTASTNVLLSLDRGTLLVFITIMVYNGYGCTPTSRLHQQPNLKLVRTRHSYVRQAWQLLIVSIKLTSVLSGLLSCRMIKLGLSIDEDEVVGEDADEDLPPLEENVDEGSRMEEVD